MPTYSYFCDHCQKEFEEFHSITEQLEECPVCKENGNPPIAPKRLISGGTGFQLLGGGWAADKYSSTK